MRGLILTIALCLAIGYIVADYFTQPNLIEEVELQWLFCGMDMQILELDMETSIDDIILHSICEALIVDGNYVGGLERSYISGEQA